MRSSTASSSGTGGAPSGGGGGGGSSSSCQDCGNKAKRDCSHTRCRTCCKSRGFPCSTHVKSTWVPVARRRQRQLHQHQVQHHQHQHHQQILLPSVDYHQQQQHRLSLPLSLSRSTSFHQHHHSPSGVQEGSFPAEVNSLATFRCIRVSMEDNAVNQYAYQTSITVGGHVFKGILYDQGPTTPRGGGGGGESSSAATSDTHLQLHQHQFDIAASTPPSSGANLPYHSPPSLYSAPFNAFLPGMQFFPHPRP